MQGTEHMFLVFCSDPNYPEASRAAVLSAPLDEAQNAVVESQKYADERSPGDLHIFVIPFGACAN